MVSHDSLSVCHYYISRAHITESWTGVCHVCLYGKSTSAAMSLWYLPMLIYSGFENAFFGFWADFYFSCMYSRGFEIFLKLIGSQKLKNKKLNPTNLVLWNSHFLNKQSHVSKLSRHRFLCDKNLWFWMFLHRKHCLGVHCWEIWLLKGDNVVFNGRKQK